MSKFWLVNSETLSLEEGPLDGPPYNMTTNCVLLEIPEELTAGNVKAELDENENIILVEDTSKTGPLWQRLRNLRDIRLASCDWTQMSDSPLSTQAKEDWVAYRQLLRDLPANTTDPEEIIWPETP